MSKSRKEQRLKVLENYIDFLKNSIDDPKQYNLTEQMISEYKEKLAEVKAEHAVLKDTPAL
jgi:hypothetical protein